MPRLRRGVIRERATRHAYSWRGLAGCRRRCSRATREVRTPLQNKLWVPGLFLSSALSLCGVSCMICRICRDGGNTFTPERYRLELISAHIHRETGPQRPTHSFWSFLFENYTHTHTNDELSDDFSLRGPFRVKNLSRYRQRPGLLPRCSPVPGAPGQGWTSALPSAFVV